MITLLCMLGLALAQTRPTETDEVEDLPASEASDDAPTPETSTEEEATTSTTSQSRTTSEVGGMVLGWDNPLAGRVPNIDLTAPDLVAEDTDDVETGQGVTLWTPHLGAGFARHGLKTLPVLALSAGYRFEYGMIGASFAPLSISATYDDGFSDLGFELARFGVQFMPLHRLDQSPYVLAEAAVPIRWDLISGDVYITLDYSVGAGVDLRHQKAHRVYLEVVTQRTLLGLYDPDQAQRWAWYLRVGFAGRTERSLGQILEVWRRRIFGG